MEISKEVQEMMNSLREAIREDIRDEIHDYLKNNLGIHHYHQNDMPYVVVTLKGDTIADSRS